MQLCMRARLREPEGVTRSHAVPRRRSRGHDRPSLHVLALALVTILAACNRNGQAPAPDAVASTASAPEAPAQSGPTAPLPRLDSAEAASVYARAWTSRTSAFESFRRALQNEATPIADQRRAAQSYRSAVQKLSLVLAQTPWPTALQEPIARLLGAMARELAALSRLAIARSDREVAAALEALVAAGGVSADARVRQALGVR
jgi:hypothetical protein